ncbi:MAG: 30S ribosomal protein S6 [Myxococcales bacterium 68-20]|nr:30S ribosomal protein S6 [Myxococcales bacterium]OJY17925.1 MAG: 30S ribosomal protein S6 [Myxococcales bacterium 68-20]
MPEAQILKSKEYETIYILRSDVDADTADKVQGRVAEVVGRDNGKLVKVESWGRRKLAYPVGKQKKGVYIYVKYVGRGGLVQELERNLKLQDSVLKFQTVLTSAEVDVQSVTVDPEEIKFQRLELPAEEEEKESREKALGLVDFGDGPRSMRGERAEDEYGEAAEAGGEAAAPPAGGEDAEPAAAKEGGEGEA